MQRANAPRSIKMSWYFTREIPAGSRAITERLQSRQLEVKLDAKIAQIVEAILRRGNDAEVRRRGDGIIVREVKETILFYGEEFFQIFLQI